MFRTISQAWALHPRIGLALRTAVAAGLAWFVAHLIPGPSTQYAYYAPLGAVVSGTFTLIGTIRDAIRSVAAIVAGAAIAVAADMWFGPSVITVAAVVAVGSLVGGWHRLRAAGTLTPTSALFVLIIGTKDPLIFIGSYAGLVLLGALIGVGITFLLPEVSLAPAQQATQRLRTALADQLDRIAGGLESDQLPDASEWEARRTSFEPLLWQVRDSIHVMGQTRRGNPRAARWRRSAEQQRMQARTLDRIVDLVDDLTAVVSKEERADSDVVGLGPDLRPGVARTLRQLAQLLHTADAAQPDVAAVAAANEALEALVSDIHRYHRETTTPGDDLFVVGSVVTSIRHVLEATSPAAPQPPPQS